MDIEQKRLFMKLQILIPQYTENEKVIGRLLYSISEQESIDFNDLDVIIVNDGSDVLLNEEFLKQYPFSINYVLNEHRGISGTRNHALSLATADYVMFCDADDMFVSKVGLANILKAIDEGFDVFTSQFYMEVKGHFIPINNDGTYIHGKVFRREFLLANEIKFPPVPCHEDNFFSTLAQVESKKSLHTDDIFYLYAYNNSSITKSKGFFVKTFGTFLEEKQMLIDELCERGYENAARITGYTVMYDCCNRYNDLKHSLQRKVKRYWNTNKDLFLGLTDNEKALIKGTMLEKFGKDLEIESFLSLV